MTEMVTFDPADLDTYPSVCQCREEVECRFGFIGGETLVFDAQGSYLGEWKEGKLHPWPPS